MATSATSASGMTRPARRRVAALVALVAVLVAGAAIAVIVLREDGEPTAGPLTSPEGSSLGIKRVVGRTFGYGLPLILNTGEQPATLDSIAPVSPTPGLELIDAQISGPQRELRRVPATLRWPSSEYTDLHPVDGFQLEPAAQPGGQRGAEIVFALRTDEPGRYVFKAIQVDYHVGDTPHRVILDSGLAVCAYPRGKRPAGECAAPVGLG